MSFKFALTVPNVNEYWWKSSKSALQRMVEEYNRENWGAQTDPVNGDNWAPRKPPTGSWPILNRTGRMFNTTTFGSDGVMLFTAKTRVNYGGFHMSGTSKMPRRRWLGIGQELTPRMEKEISQHIFRGRKTYRISG